MSKMDALRAMREARYEAATRQAATSSPPRRTRPAQQTAAPAAPVAPADSAGALCGHKSMNGRTCTREHGHAAKSHRYS